MPVLDREEYIEQAYFFHAFRERVLDGMPAQDVLSRVGEELLSTTKLPLAISFLATEIKVIGLMAPAMARLGHYFTGFQTHVIDQAEHDVSRFPMDQALRVGRPADDFAVRTLAGAVIGVSMSALLAALDDPKADYLELIDIGLGRLENGLQL